MPKTHENSNRLEKRVPAVVLSVTMGIMALAGCSKEEAPREASPSPRATATLDPTETPSVESSPTTTPSVESSPTMTPSMDVSSEPISTPSASETSIESGEIPPNAIDYDDIKQQFDNLTVANVNEMIKQQDLQTMASYLSLAYLDHLTNYGDQTGSTDIVRDCAVGPYSPESPLLESVATKSDSEPKRIVCSFLGVDNLIGNQVDATFINSETEPLNKKKAEIVARLAYGFAASQDNYSKKILDGALYNIENTDTIYSVDYHDVPRNSEILSRGTMEFNGSPIDYIDVLLPGDEFGPRDQRILLVPLEQPIVRKVPIIEQPPYNAYMDPEEDRGYGEMQYTIDENGDARPVVPVKIGSDEMAPLVIPINGGSPVLYRDNVILSNQ